MIAPRVMPQIGGLLQPYGYTPVALGPFDRTGMSPQALAFADAFSAATGDRVIGVNSAHRDASHNAAVGGARGSQHIQGNALDLDVSGMSEEERIALINTARGLGAGGVGVYNNALHFDVGPTRAWGSDYHAGSIPEWAAAAVGAPRTGGDRVASSGGTETMTGGAGGDSMAGLLSTPQEPARRPSIWDRLEGVPILGGLADPDRRARLAIGLGGMSLNPNQMLMAMNAQGIQDRATERETAGRLNQTIAYLQSIGRDDLVALAQVDPGAALQTAMQPPERVEPIEVNGQLIDPVTMEVLGDYRTPEAAAPGFRMATAEEQATYGAPGQIGPDNRFYPLNADGGITITNPDGTVTQIGGTARPLTESEGRNTGFFARMRDSNAIIEGLESEGTSLLGKIASGIPLVGNYLQSPEYQQYQQAQDDFLAAILRRESGAVISDQERAAGARQYFPQPGDSPEVIAQKAANRRNAILGVEVSSGDGATRVGDITQSTLPPSSQEINGVLSAAPVVRTYDPATDTLR